MIDVTKYDLTGLWIMQNGSYAHLVYKHGHYYVGARIEEDGTLTRNAGWRLNGTSLDGHQFNIVERVYGEKRIREVSRMFKEALEGVKRP